MRPKSITAKIFSTPDEFQTMLFEYEHVIHSEMFKPGSSTVEVNFCKLLQRLRIDASDLETDLITAISEDLSCPQGIINISCEVEQAFTNVRV